MLSHCEIFGVAFMTYKVILSHEVGNVRYTVILSGGKLEL